MSSTTIDIRSATPSMSSLLSGVRRLAEATPESHNRHVDFPRAFSILVVVFGHWLMAGPGGHPVDDADTDIEGPGQATRPFDGTRVKVPLLALDDGLRMMEEVLGDVGPAWAATPS